MGALKLEYKKGLFNGYTHIYIGIMGKLQPLECIEYDELEEVINKYSGYYDIYATQNTISNTYTRTNKDILQLRTLYIDIDNINNIDEVITVINDLVKDKSIPKPHKIIFSGRGVHVKWFIKDYAGTSKKNMNVWSRLQNHLIKTFKDSLKSIGEVDTRVKDPARVLRVEGTINSKSDKVVKCLVNNKHELYDLYDLYNTYTPYKPQKVTERKKSKAGIKLLKSKATLNNARLKDLEKILELREYDLTGIRNSFLMFYTTYYILVNNSTYEDTLQEIKSVASRIKSKNYTSLAELNSFVRNGVKKVEEHKKGYKVLPKSETIIEWLQISEDEQRELITLKSKEIKQENNNAQRREKRRNDEGLTSREQQKRDTIKAIQELKEKGFNNTQIADKLNMNVRSVRRILNSN